MRSPLAGFSRFIVLMVVLRLAGSAFALGGSAPASDLSTRLDSYLVPYVSSRNFTGVVLVARHGKVEFERAYGMADYEHRVPNTVATRFHIASISKPFTAAAILMLAEQKRLSLDDPVKKYLPDFPNGNSITLRHLLTHTSGIPNVNNVPEYAVAQHSPQTPLSLIALFKDKPLDFPPGARYAYSNSNYNILAYVIEKLTGKGYGAAIREMVLQPLRLKNTAHDGDAATLIPNSASGYEPSGARALKKMPSIDWTAKTGNGSLYSTAEDLLKFDLAMHAGKLLGKETLDMLWTERPGHNYGWFTRKRLGRRAAASNGRSPGFVSSLEHYLDDDVVVIVLSNSYSAVTQSPIAYDIAAIALGEKPQLAQPMTAVSPSAAELSKAVGRYKFGADYWQPNAEASITVKDGQLRMDLGSGNVIELTPVGGGRYLDRLYWSYATFDPENGALSYGADPVFRAVRLP